MGQLLPCRGHENRIQICRDYTIFPVVHAKLLKGQSIPSCAGGTIVDHYYRFHAVLKADSSKEYTIFCGYEAAADFCSILGVETPPLFDPLKNVGLPGTGTGGASSASSPTAWNPAMLQLVNAINILLCFWPKRADSVLESVLREVSPYPTKRPYTRFVKSVNTMLRNAKTTMRAVLTRMEAENGPVKDYRFDELIKILEKESIPQYFEP